MSASNADGAYKAGQTIHVQVNFSEPVTVTGTPQLALNTSPAESAIYASGSGTSTLVFDYTVQAGDNVATSTTPAPARSPSTAARSPTPRPTTQP